MRNALIFLVIVIIIFSFFGCKKNNNPINSALFEPGCVYTPVKYDNMFRMGPVLLKFDKEWLFEENEKQIIRIGLRQIEEGFSTDELDEPYKHISPEKLAIKTNYEYLVNDDSPNRSSDILTYDIECNDSEFWVDLNFEIANRYDNGSDINVITFIAARSFFIYHPIRKKWWGFNSPEPEIALIEDVYDKTMTIEKVYNLFSNDNTKMMESIINRRTLYLPSIDVYEGYFSEINGRFLLYGWFCEEDTEESVGE